MLANDATRHTMLIQKIAENGFLNEDEIRATVTEACASMDVDGKRVLFIIPDSTRSMPLPLLFRVLFDALHGRVAKMDYLIALGTHPPMPESAINHMLGVTADERTGKFASVEIFNHAWRDPEALTTIGRLTEDDIEEISGGLLRESVEVTINKRVLDYDLICIVGPVFPHEVVGFSGGYKYFFPGVAGEAILDVFHWLGALITNYKINGTKDTPVRAVINKAASLVPTKTVCFCLTVVRKDTKAVFFGEPLDAWSAAADLSSQTHIIYKKKPFKTVLAIAPPMYDEIWVAGKCMYKLEPVVADGGELIIYGGHIHEVSVTHDVMIKKVGYHVRDYFTKQADRFADIPGTIKAHSTHVRGNGTYEAGVEKPRVDVTLATSIPEEVCRQINLGYRDINSINVSEYESREDEGILVVHNAGEILYRIEGE